MRLDSRNGEYLKTRSDIPSNAIATQAIVTPLLTRRGGLSAATVSLDAVRHGVRAAQRWLLDRQEPDGHWVAELEGDTILEIVGEGPATSTPAEKK